MTADAGERRQPFPVAFGPARLHSVLDGTPYIMRYYIRHDKNAAVEGPFTIESLRDAIRSRRIGSDVLASSDLGEGIASLQVWRSYDWFPLAAITELRDIVAPLPEPPAKPRRVSVFAVCCYVGAALTFSYGAITERRWLVCVLAILMVYSAVDRIMRYVRQREKRSPAV